MNTLNQEESGCYLLKIHAFRARAKASIEKIAFKGPALLVDSLYTMPEGHDAFNYNRTHMFVDGVYFKGFFPNMKKAGIYMYSNIEQNTCILTLTSFVFDKNQDMDAMSLLLDEYREVTFAVHTVLPKVDMVAAKLAS